jgi:DNA invertase Pin-like site-specific DNA recombinase
MERRLKYMALYGYHRTSTKDQHLDRGITAIREYCDHNGLVLDEMFTDQQTGKNFDRPDYQAMKRIAKKSDDCIILAELDRLGRNKEDILKELRHYRDIGVRIMILELPTTLIDYSKLNDVMAKMMMETINNMLIEMYATLAHAEMLKREKRQVEGMQAMKDRGEWDRYGRPAAMDFKHFSSEYKRVVANEIKPTALMRELGMKKPTFYKYVKRYKSEHTAKNG